MLTKNLNRILSEYALTIEKRIERYDHIELHFLDGNDIFDEKTVLEKVVGQSSKTPAEVLYFLIQYGDVIYQTSSLNEMVNYVLGHFKLDN